MRNTSSYCNPTPLPNYPKGMFVDEKEIRQYGWPHPDDRQDFRETADPAVLYHEGKWYLYVSCGSAYVSEDFINWEHHPIEPYNLEYDPGVTKVGDQFILSACRTPIHVGDNPLGPFKELGRVKDPQGNAVDWSDPHIFADGDRVYAYWGIAGPGIYGAEMDPNDLCQLITEPKVMFGFDPTHEWERTGEHNEDPTISFVEGAWMHKHDGRYYLVYSAPGTEWNSYGLGYYVSESPLGPFEYGSNNPFVRKEHGYVTGTGHGCLTEGPNGTTWAFYTCIVRNEHNFERRIGYDQVHFDENGVPFCNPTEIPQPIPGITTKLDWIPLTTNRAFRHSSGDHRNASGLYALDNNMKTWWLPSPQDKEPTLEVFLKQPIQKKSNFRLRAARLHWKENFLDYSNGRLPQPIGYRIEYKKHLADKEWSIALDLTDNQSDLLQDYREIPEIEAQAVRLVVSKNPYPGELGVIDFTVFGEPGDQTIELQHMN